VGDYLKLPFRCVAVDRVLVDVLVGLEVYAYGEQMLNGSRFASPLRSRHVLFQFLFGQVVNAIALFGLAYLFLKFGWPNTIWAEVIAAVLGFLFFAFLVISLRSLRRAWQLQWSAHKEVRKLIKTMDKVYRELSAGGPISGRHIHCRVPSQVARGINRAEGNL
jgi:hypothetical protein